MTTRFNQAFRNVIRKANCNLIIYDKNAPVCKTAFDNIDIINSGSQSSIKDGQSMVNCDLQCRLENELACEINVNFVVQKGQFDSAGFGVEFEIDEWQTDNYVLFPGSVYNGNRFKKHKLEYFPFLCGPDYFNSKDINTTDLAGLCPENNPSLIEQNTGDMATPCMGYYSPKKKNGFLVFSQQANDLGNYGMFLDENPEKRRAVFSVNSPCVRRQRKHMTMKVESNDRGIYLAEGDSINIKLLIVFFEGSQLQQLFKTYSQYRKYFEGESSLRPVIPFSEAFEIIKDKHNLQNWIEKPGYYAVGTDHSKLCFTWQLGWVGGCMATEAFWLEGDEHSQNRAQKNLEEILTHSQAKSGFFYGIGDKNGYWGDGFLEPHPYNMHLIRKNADTLYFFVKQFVMVETKYGISIADNFKNAVRRQADAFVRLWDKNHDFGQFIDIETGEILVGSTCSAAMAPGGLIMAGAYFDNEKYKQTALESARYYYENFTKKGLTNGGPGDVLQAPDSESAFALLESFVVIYEFTQEKYWLKAAEDMALQCSSWCVSYDYKFPEKSLFKKLGICATGAVIANAQNKHGAPGICTLSGDSLFKLFRATGNPFYMDLLNDIARGLPQYLSTEARPVGTNPPGWINERCNMSDWEGKDRIGEVMNEASWPEVSLMLTWTEVPGVYCQPDKGLLWVIDNIDYEIISKSAGRLVFKLINPTEYMARIKMYAESFLDGQKPLLTDFTKKQQIITLKPGEAETWVFETSKSGQAKVLSFETSEAIGSSR
jgi:hypothetical protein